MSQACAFVMRQDMQGMPHGCSGVLKARHLPCTAYYLLQHSLVHRRKRCEEQLCCALSYTNEMADETMCLAYIHPAAMIDFLSTEATPCWQAPTNRVCHLR
jgi:hypothetical protein